jgi:acetyl esterase
MSETLITVHRTGIPVNGRRPEILGNDIDENMIATLALVAKHNGGPDLECQIILWSATDSSFTAKSYQEYADGYLWLQA